MVMLLHYKCSIDAFKYDAIIFVSSYSTFLSAPFLPRAWQEEGSLHVLRSSLVDGLDLECKISFVGDSFYFHTVSHVLYFYSLTVESKNIWTIYYYNYHYWNSIDVMITTNASYGFHCVWFICVGYKCALTSITTSSMDNWVLTTSYEKRSSHRLGGIHRLMEWGPHFGSETF